MSDAGMQRLCDAIILRAAQDAEIAIRKRDYEQIKILGRFFRSPWCSALMGAESGKVIMNKLIQNKACGARKRK